MKTTMEKYKIESKLDTNRFGFKVGKTDGLIFNNNTELVKNRLIDDGYKLIISRVDINNIDLINEMESIGFRIKDTQITYKYDLENMKNDFFDMDSFLEIRDYKKNDLDRLIDITKESFNNYGHYFLNKNLDKKKCIEVYEDWVYNSCINSDITDKIIVAIIDGDPVGYLTFKTYKNKEYSYAAGGIGAVDSNHRGKNIFPNLLKYGLNWGMTINLTWQEHNVIVNNYSVNRSMNKIGFKPGNMVTTMHCWL